MVHCTIAQYSSPCLNNPSYTVVATVKAGISHEIVIAEAHSDGRDEKNRVRMSRFRVSDVYINGRRNEDRRIQQHDITHAR